MNGSPQVRAAGAVALALVLLAVACGGGEPPPGSEKVSAASSVGDCLRPDPAREGGYLQAACASSLATVEITHVVEGDGSGPHCPAGTDALADATQGPVSGGEIDAPTAIWCLRNLAAPHPGDPGLGGGELVTGDCFSLGGAGDPQGAEGGTDAGTEGTPEAGTEGGTEGTPEGGTEGTPEAGTEGTSDVTEVPCAGATPPQYELLATVTRSEDCPPRDVEPIELASPRFTVLCGRSLADDEEAPAGG